MWLNFVLSSLIRLLFIFPHKPSSLPTGGQSIWAITKEERDNHDKQFDSLSPTLGYVSGRALPRRVDTVGGGSPLAA